MTALAVVARYLQLVVWPLRLSADYSFPQIPIAIGTARDWIAWAVVAASGGLSLFAVRINRALAFVLAAAFLVFLPGSNLLFTSGTIMAERLIYLPSLAVIAAAAAGVSAITSRSRQLTVPLSVASVIVLIAFAVTCAYVFFGGNIRTPANTPVAPAPTTTAPQ